MPLKNINKRRQYEREYSKKHRDKILEKNRKWRLKNPDKVREMRKRYREKNKEKLREYERKRKLNVRLEVLSHYSDKSTDFPHCSCCGETIFAFLTIDHIHGGGRKHIQNLWAGSGSKLYDWLKKNNYPEGYQVLCYNCNCAKGHYGKCPHVEMPTN